VRALVAALDRYLASDPEPDDADAARLRNTLGALEAALAKPDANELVERAESNVLATLPQSLELLSKALEASPVTADTLPDELRARWRSASGVDRIEAFPRGGIDLEDQPALERFVRAVQSVAPAAVGPPVVVLESGAAVVRAFGQACLFSLLSIGTLVLVVLRRPREAALVLAPLLLSLCFAASTMVLLGIDLNFANVIALPLVVGIGVDSGIFIVAHDRHGATARGDLLASSTARAVLYNALTNLASFVSLALSAHPGTASLGATLAIAILWTLAGSLVVLPALLECARGRACAERAATL
jgi:predicted RND superfamily exporter protein